MPSERSSVLLQSLWPYYLNVSNTTPTMYWLLLTGAPAVSGGTYSGLEVATAGYARQTSAMSSPTFNSTLGLYEIANSTAITFGPFTADVAPTITYVACTKGNGSPATYWWPVNLPTVLNGDSVYFPTSSLVIRSGDA